MFRKLFGTDGIRGEWGNDINPELAYELGKAISILFNIDNDNTNIIIGKDPRISSDILECALISGITAMGSNVVKLGVVPTAVVPFSINEYKATAGVMITASHNESKYNGFKIFNGNGFRISKEQESRIEYIISNNCDYVINRYSKLGKIKNGIKFKNKYINCIKKELGELKNLKILVDCANGSACSVVKKIFNKNFSYIFDNPNGLNINEYCGANHIDNLCKYIKDTNYYDLGLAYDGDADRVIFVDKFGEIIPSEYIIYNLLKFYKYNSLVTTKMSNSALINQLEKENILTKIVEVGESAIITGLLENNGYLGVENNGHYLFLNKGKSSDGILSSILILNMLICINNFKTPFKNYYKREINIYLNNKDNILSNQNLKNKIELCESLLNENGRILIRPSGTEKALRVLIEGNNQLIIKEIEDVLIKEIEKYKNI